VVLNVKSSTPWQRQLGASVSPRSRLSGDCRTRSIGSLQQSPQSIVNRNALRTMPIIEAPVLGDSCGHFHEAGKRLGPHFSHDLASMRLYRDLAYPELATDLFIQHTDDDQSHDLSFAVTK